MTLIRSVGTFITAGAIGAAGLAFGANAPSAQVGRFPHLVQFEKEKKELYNQITASLVRVEVAQSAAAILDGTGLRAEFEAWRQSAAGIAFTGGAGSRGRGNGNSSGGDRGGRGGGGRSENPQGGGFGRGGGPGGLANQIRGFLQDKIAKSGNETEIARIKGLLLRLDLNRNGFQGELSAVLLDDAGRMLLPTGLIREAHAGPLKVTLPDGTEASAKFVGANLYSNYSILQFEKIPSACKPITLSITPITPGDTLMSITAGQGLISTVQVSGRLAIASDERGGVLLFDFDGKFAGLSTGGAWSPERPIMQAQRLAREVASIVKTNKDIEQKSLGIAFELLNKDPVRSSQIATLMGTRRGLVVKQIDANSLAASAGLKKDDVIVSIDGRPVRFLVSGEGTQLSELTLLQVDLATRHGTVAIGIIRNEPTGDREESLQMNLDAPATTPSLLK